MSGQVAAISTLTIGLVGVLVLASWVIGLVDILRMPGWAWQRAEKSRIAYLLLVILIPVVGLLIYVFTAQQAVATVAKSGRAASLPHEGIGSPTVAAVGARRATGTASPPANFGSFGAASPPIGGGQFGASPPVGYGGMGGASPPVGYSAFGGASPPVGYGGFGAASPRSMARPVVPASSTSSPSPCPRSSNRRCPEQPIWRTRPSPRSRRAGRPTPRAATSSATGTASSGRRAWPTPASSRSTLSSPGRGRGGPA